MTLTPRIEAVVFLVASKSRFASARVSGFIFQFATTKGCIEKVYHAQVPDPACQKNLLLHRVLRPLIKNRLRAPRLVRQLKDMKGSLANKKGFTLIEVLVTVFLVGMLLVGFTAVIKISALSRVSQHQEIALRIATYALEEARAQPFASTTSGSFADANLAELAQATGTLTVTSLNAKTNQLTVTVSWQEQAMGTSSISLSTLKTETGGL